MNSMNYSSEKEMILMEKKKGSKNKETKTLS